VARDPGPAPARILRDMRESVLDNHGTGAYRSSRSASARALRSGATTYGWRSLVPRGP
jgi:hypothetical protein